MKNILTSLAGLLLFCSGASASIHAFFSTSNSPSALWQVAIDGTLPTRLRGLPSAGRSIAVNPSNGHIYYQVASRGLYTNYGLLPLGELPDFDLGSSSGLLYYYGSGSSGSGVYRINPDGTGQQLIWQGPASPSLIGAMGIAVDEVNGHIYLGDAYGDRIVRVGLDGSNPTTIVSFGVNVELQDLAVAGGKLYWTDQFIKKIQRSNFDGTSIEDVVLNVNARRIAIEQAGGKVYWGSPEESSGSGSTLTITRQGGLWRANLDGTAEELFLANNGDIHGIAFGNQGYPYPTVPSVPEPSSFLTWSMLVGLAGGIVRHSQFKRKGGQG